MLKFVRLAAMGASLGAAAASHAALVLTFDMTVEGQAPLGTNWATLTFTDDGPDRVMVEVRNQIDQPGTNFFSRLFFNLRPGQVAAWAQPRNDFRVTDVQFDLAQGGPQFNGGAGYHGFEVSVHFPTANAQRLLPGMTATFFLTGPGLNESSFAYTSAGVGVPPAYAMLHVQADRFDDSLRIIAPYPGPAAALPFAFGFLARRRRRSR